MPSSRTERHLVRALALGAVLAGAAAAAPAVEKERAEVPEAPSVSVSGVRYQAPPFTRSAGLPHNGGYVEAVDEQSGRRLWLVEVVPLTPTAAGMEQDKREVFITGLTLLPDTRELLVTDERGQRYRLDLGTHRVTPLGEP